jgi:hypothetical protein
MGPSGFTSHPKEGVLRIVIALKNPSPRFEPVTFGSSVKHTNHFTTEATKRMGKERGRKPGIKNGKHIARIT